MIKKILLLLIFISSSTAGNMVFAQVSINASGAQPDKSAQLDVSSTSKGILIPRMTTAQRNAISSPAKGLLVYDSTVTSLWYYNGTAWQQISAGTAGWSLTGNSNINTSANFLGTTDKKPLVFKVNSNTAAYLDTVSNTALGSGALSANTSAYSNTAIGTDALYSDTTGGNLVAIGDSALYHNQYHYDNYYDFTYGIDNTAIGSKTLYGNTTGYDNTAVGYQTLEENTTGYENTIAGFLSLYRGAGGGTNTAIGSEALSYATYSSGNVGVGDGTLESNTSGFQNTAYGYQALLDIISGNNNTGIGIQSLYANQTGGDNTADGAYALNSGSGNYNTAIGYDAMASGGPYDENTAIGYGAFQKNSGGADNTATGYEALYTFTGYDPSGNKLAHNTGIGAYALYSTRFGTSNTGIGAYALNRNIDGYNNIAVGYRALYANTNGKSSTAIGYNAGLHFVAVRITETNVYGYADNLFLGANTDVSGNDSLMNVVAIGQAVACTANNQVRIGNSATTSIGGYANWSNISDGRVKRNIRKNVPGLAFITQLAPVTYNLNLEAADAILQSQRAAVPSDGVKENNAATTQLETVARREKEAVVYSGFVAQDVEKAAEKQGYHFSGVDVPEDNKGLYTLRYADLVAPLVKAVQELSKTNDALKKKHGALEARLEKAEAALKMQQ